MAESERERGVEGKSS